MKLACILFCACAMAARFAEAFVPALGARAGVISATARRASISPFGASRENAFSSATFEAPASLRSVTKRPSSAARSSTTMGLFGLGAPEIAVCIVVAALVLGPDKLTGVAKDVGKMAGELKDVPKEFQAGIAEGEQKAAQAVKQIGTDADATVMDAEPATKKEEKEKA